MGGRSSRRTNTYSAPVIQRNNIVAHTYEEKGITSYNYKTKLSKYNLTQREMKQIEIALYCDYKFTIFNKFYFNNRGNGKFTMYCYTFKIRANRDGESEVKIKTNRLEYNATCN